MGPKELMGQVGDEHYDAESYSCPSSDRNAESPNPEMIIGEGKTNGACQLTASSEGTRILLVSRGSGQEREVYRGGK